MRVLAAPVVLLVASLAALPARGQAQTNPDGGVDADPNGDPGGSGAFVADDPDAGVQDFPLELSDESNLSEELPLADDMVVEEGELEQDQVIADSYDDGYDPQAYTHFQDALAPYGTWADDPAYGMVWEPSQAAVGADFSPYYTNGYWDMTEYGWTWVSGYDWGWAPFHYGRWVVIAGRGWCWIPGTIWGPSWVSWRAGGGYVGWAPMPPHGVHVPGYHGHRSAWRFVPAHQLGGRRRYDCAPPHRMSGIWRGSRVVAHQKSLWRGSAHVQVHPGPIREVRRKAARLAAIAPHTLPKKRVLPSPGQSVTARPWVRHAIANPPRPIGRPGAGPRTGGTPGWSGGGGPVGVGGRRDVGGGIRPTFPPVSRPMPRPAGAIGRRFPSGGAGAGPGVFPNGGGFSGSPGRPGGWAGGRPVTVSPPGRPTLPPPGNGPRFFRAGETPGRVLPRMTPQPPPRTFGAPAPSFQAPRPSFGARPFPQPRPSFVPQPRPTFAAPTPQFQGPRPIFQAAPTFQAPRPTFPSTPQFQRPSPPTPITNGGFGARPPMPGGGGGFGARPPMPGGGGGFGARPAFNGSGAGARIGGAFRGGAR